LQAITLCAKAESLLDQLAARPECLPQPWLCKQFVACRWSSGAECLLENLRGWSRRLKQPDCTLAEVTITLTRLTI